MITKKSLVIMQKFAEYPDRTWSISELAREARLPKTTVWRVVNILSDMGVLTKMRKGSVSLVELRDKAYARDISKIMSAGQVKMEAAAKKFSRALTKLGYVKKCILFGSVARKTAAIGSDIDVLVLLDRHSKAKENEINILADKISSSMFVRIMPDIMDVPAFRKLTNNGSMFIKSIKKEGRVLYERPS